jgi:glycosyltransferase involved in cell wall biosynthesis
VPTVHAVLPNDIDDPAAPSGGNSYDRRVLRGLADLGWTVREHAVPGGWPDPRPAERAGLARRLATLPAGAVVLVDGLVASAVPDVLGPECRRLRLVVLVHRPLGGDGERAALAAARAVIATSPWTRDRLDGLDGLDAVFVATPGVDPAPLAPGSAAGTRLLCVAAVTRHKGHDLLAAALAGLGARCRCVGSLTRDPAFVATLPTDRLELLGPLVGAELAAAYAEADLLVLPSRGETYGMVVTEALAHGIPVLATAVDALPRTLGTAPDGSVPGLLVAPAELAGALRRWLADAGLRDRLRRSARDRRGTLTGWDVTARQVAAVLERVRA